MEKILNQLSKISTDKEITSNSPKSFAAFLNIYESCGGTVNDVSASLIKESMENNGITNSKLKKALLKAFENDEYGKLTWGKIMTEISHEQQLTRAVGMNLRGT